jgi:hypothetical protein
MVADLIRFLCVVMSDLCLVANVAHQTTTTALSFDLFLQYHIVDRHKLKDWLLSQATGLHRDNATHDNMPFGVLC